MRQGSESLKICFPQTALKGCWFHYCQAVRRNISTNWKELIATIRNNKKASLSYHKIMALPLVPAHAMKDVYENIKSEINKHDGHCSFAGFLNYFETQWIKKVGPESISVYRESFRTTSSVEALNGVLGRLIQPNGNFFKFVLALNKEELEKSRKFNILTESGGSFGAPKRRKLSRDRNDKIKEAADDLQNGKITVYSYLNRLVYPKNYICVEQESISDIFEEPCVDDPGDTSSDEGESTSNNNSVCIICQDAQPNIVVLPCKHLKMCNECFIQLQAHSESNTKCPYCRQVVADSFQAFL